MPYLRISIRSKALARMCAVLLALSLAAAVVLSMVPRRTSPGPAAVQNAVTRVSPVAASVEDDAPVVASWRRSVADAMRGRPGIAVVVDRASGRVLAANEPAAERTLWLPGSTLKPFVLWALLASGKLTATETLACPRALTIGDHNFACSHPLLSTPVTAETALAYSCNNFVAHFAARLQPGELAAFLNSHGFHHASPLSGNGALLEALGEEGVRVSAVELARAYARLASEAPQPVLEGLRSSRRVRDRTPGESGRFFREDRHGEWTRLVRRLHLGCRGGGGRARFLGRRRCRAAGEADCRAGRRLGRPGPARPRSPARVHDSGGICCGGAGR